MGIDAGHIGEANQRPIDISGKRHQPGLERTGHARGKGRILDDRNRTVADSRAHLGRLMSEDDDDGPGAGSQNGIHGAGDHGLARHLRQQLVRTAHAARPAGGHDDGRHARRTGNGGRFVARLRAGDDFLQQPASAHAHDVGAPDRQVGDEPAQHPIQAIDFGRAGAARQPQDGAVAEAAQQQQIAGVDRHAEMDDLPARRRDRRRNYIAPIGDGGSTGDQQQIHIVQPSDGRLEIGRLMRATPFDRRPAMQPRQPLIGDLECLVEHALLDARQAGLDQANPAGLQGRQTQDRPALAGDGQASVQHEARNGKGNDLDRRRHVAGGQQVEGSKRGQGDRFIHHV